MKTLFNIVKDVFTGIKEIIITIFNETATNENEDFVILSYIFLPFLTLGFLLKLLYKHFFLIVSFCTITYMFRYIPQTDLIIQYIVVVVSFLLGIKIIIEMIKGVNYEKK